MPLGNRVREFRKARGESTRDLGLAVGLSHVAISRLERGDIGCSDEKKVALARHFGVSVTDLFFQDNGNNLLPEPAMPA